MEAIIIYYFKKNQKLISLIMMVLAGLLCGFGSIYVILILLFSIIAFFCFYKTETVFIILFSAIYIIPFNDELNEILGLTLPIMNLYYATLALIVLTAVVVVKSIIAKERLSQLLRFGPYFLLMGVIFAYIIYGIVKENLFVRADAELYIYCLVFFLTSVLLKSNKEVDKVIKIIIINSILLSIVVILIYIFRNSFLSFLISDIFGENTSRLRFGTGGQTTFSVVIPLIYSLINYRLITGKWALFGYIAISLMVVSAIISESRALFFAIALNFSIVYIWLWIRGDQGNIYKKMLSIILSVSIIFLILFSGNYFLGHNEKITSFKSRMIELSNYGRIDSYSTRQVTNNINFEKINNRPLGHGIGEPIALYNTFGELVQYGTFVDNVVITIMYKMGYIGLLAFLLFYMKMIHNIFRVSRLDKDKKWHIMAVIIILCLPMYLVNGGYFAAHLLSNYAVNSFTMFVFAVMDNRLNEIRILKQDVT